MSPAASDFVPIPHAKARDGAYFKTEEAYEEVRRQALDAPERYWARRAGELLDFAQEWDRVLDFDPTRPLVRWLPGARLNVAHNCIDRHLETRRNKAALIWQGENEDDVTVYTYQILHTQVCRFSAALSSMGLGLGDTVAIHLPTIPELAVAMLACARIGVTHVVLFAGFPAAGLAERITDSQARVLITADGARRMGRVTPLKETADEALAQCPTVEQVVVVNNAGLDVTMRGGRDAWWHELIADEDLTACALPAEVPADHPLFVLHKSGGRSSLQGVVHGSAGYLLYAAHTMQTVFDLRDQDIIWCTAEIGWITSHTSTLYGPLALGGTTLMFEGAPTWPEPDRFWSIIEKFRVSIFHTAPSVLRGLIREGAHWPGKHDLSSLRILGSVGDTLGSETWRWYFEHVGNGRLPVVDCWQQTETGGPCIAPMPYASPLKPGTVGKPLPGIDARVVDAQGADVPVGARGHLVIAHPWPGMMLDTPEHFTKQGRFATGDAARIDEDGQFTILGRLDEALGGVADPLDTAEVETTLVSHPAVAEAAAVGVGEGSIAAYVSLKSGREESEELAGELAEVLEKRFGERARSARVYFAETLPKTRSGKIERRVLRQVASGRTEDLDTSALADPASLSDLIESLDDLFTEK
jgi:acetyl-CoA synthetase